MMVDKRPKNIVTHTSWVIFVQPLIYINPEILWPYSNKYIVKIVFSAPPKLNLIEIALIFGLTDQFSHFPLTILPDMENVMSAASAARVKFYGWGKFLTMYNLFSDIL